MTSSLHNILVRNLGCKVNLADAAMIVDRLSSDQCRLVDNPEQADVFVLNTCTVTHKADRDVRKILNSIQKYHPNLPVIVTGCGVKNHMLDLSQYSNIRHVVEPGKPQEVAKAVLGLIGSKSNFTNHFQSADSPFMRIGRHRAFVKVQDGCNSRCTYCIVPHTRGNERSLPVNDVLDQIQRLVDLGHREIVLTGVHLGRYGQNLDQPNTLAGLCEALSPVFDRMGDGFRLRLSSIEPLEWTPELFEIVCLSKFICHHFHIPLQSADDSILRKMNRPYQAANFSEIVTKLHERLPQASLGTDILVGFPGESESAAQNTYNTLSSLPISYLHVFTYSPRPGTLASSMPDQVDHLVVLKRAFDLRKLGQKLSHNFLQQGVGRTHSVLIEKHNSDGSFGRSGNYQPFRLETKVGKPGQMVEVIAKKVYKDLLVGVPCKKIPDPA